LLLLTEIVQGVRHQALKINRSKIDIGNMTTMRQSCFAYPDLCSGNCQLQLYCTKYFTHLYLQPLTLLRFLTLVLRVVHEVCNMV